MIVWSCFNFSQAQKRQEISVWKKDWEKKEHNFLTCTHLLHFSEELTSTHENDRQMQWSQEDSIWIFSAKMNSVSEK